MPVSPSAPSPGEGGSQLAARGTPGCWAGAGSAATNLHHTELRVPGSELRRVAENAPGSLLLLVWVRSPQQFLLLPEVGSFMPTGCPALPSRSAAECLSLTHPPRLRSEGSGSEVSDGEGLCISELSSPVLNSATNTTHQWSSLGPFRQPQNSIARAGFWNYIYKQKGSQFSVSHTK